MQQNIRLEILQYIAQQIEQSEDTPVTTGVITGRSGQQGLIYHAIKPMHFRLGVIEGIDDGAAIFRPYTDGIRDWLGPAVLIPFDQLTSEELEGLTKRLLELLASALPVQPVAKVWIIATASGWILDTHDKLPKQVCDAAPLKTAQALARFCNRHGLAVQNIHAIKPAYHHLFKY